ARHLAVRVTDPWIVERDDTMLLREQVEEQRVPRVERAPQARREHDRLAATDAAIRDAHAVDGRVLGRRVRRVACRCRVRENKQKQREERGCAVHDRAPTTEDLMRYSQAQRRSTWINVRFRSGVAIVLSIVSMASAVAASTAAAPFAGLVQRDWSVAD